jgi:hypothetical protein
MAARWKQLAESLGAFGGETPSPSPAYTRAVERSMDGKISGEARGRQPNPR